MTDGAEQRRTRAALPRRFGLALAAIPVLAVGIADATIALRTASAPAPAHAVAAPAPSRTTTATSAPRFTLNDAEQQRNRALRDLLDRRQQAILHHDLAAFLATDDPKQPAFRAAQKQEFEALEQIPLASWSFQADFSVGLPLSPRALRYGVPAYAPSQFSAHYRIAGFDDKPTSLVQTPTFVQRGTDWYVASFDDFAAQGNPSAVDIWDFGPIRTVQAGSVLVIGHPSSLALMRQIATQTAASVPRVTKVWGRGWARKAVVLVPATQRELSRILGDNSDLSQIAAVASAEVMSCPGSPDPVGDRIAINPGNWSKLSFLGRSVVLTHELTHVATRAATNACMPTWLVEGFADYVAYQQTTASVRLIGSDLAVDVRAGRTPKTLPPDSEFDGASKQLAQAYEGGFMACRLIASLAGQQGLVRFYAAVGESKAAPATALADALRTGLHLTTAQFVDKWRTYLRQQLS